jgi:hypothetical protein
LAHATGPKPEGNERVESHFHTASNGRLDAKAHICQTGNIDDGED